MSDLFFDSSALVKRYLTESGSGWVTALTDPVARNTIVVATITRVEVAAAFAARQRASSGITQAERDLLFDLLIRHYAKEYRTVAMGTALLDQAMHLTQRHRLRGYDAVQLAAALAASRVLPSITLIAADSDLLQAAHAEGLATDDPNNY